MQWRAMSGSPSSCLVTHWPRRLKEALERERLNCGGRTPRVEFGFNWRLARQNPAVNGAICKSGVRGEADAPSILRIITALLLAALALRLRLQPRRLRRAPRFTRGVRIACAKLSRRTRNKSRRENGRARYLAAPETESWLRSTAAIFHQRGRRPRLPRQMPPRTRRLKARCATQMPARCRRDGAN